MQMEREREKGSLHNNKRMGKKKIEKYCDKKRRRDKQSDDESD